MEFNKEELVKSSLNYTGGKFKLLPQILPLFPDKIDTFVDLFCGGLDVSINVRAKKIISNDIIYPLIELYKYWDTTNTEYILKEINDIIKKFNLNKTNLEGYLELRNEYNNTKNVKLLFPLISYCYNNQIRFNKSWEFNRHFGKNRSSFNDKMSKNLKNTLSKIRNNNFNFMSKDVFSIDFSNLNKNDFVYIDPPYLITYGDYSIQAKWNEEKEIKLLDILDKLNSMDIKFSLSNVLKHNGKCNDILKKWSNNYNIHYLNYDYSNANADKKDKSKNSSIEVLITNY